MNRDSLKADRPPSAVLGWNINGPYTGTKSGSDTRYWGEDDGAVLYGNNKNDSRVRAKVGDGTRDGETAAAGSHPDTGGLIMDMLDELLAARMTPAMIDAGFRRTRRKYAVLSPDGNLVVVRVTPWGGNDERLSFHVDWWAVPAVLREYHQRYDPKAGAASHGALFLTRLRVPPDLREQPYFGSLWWFKREQFDSFGARFEDEIRTDAIPRWTASLTRDYLLTASTQDSDVSQMDSPTGFGGPVLTPLLLNIDDGDPAELQHLLDDAYRPRGDDFLEWLQARLDTRVSG
jgi:hypothetical protein